MLPSILMALVTLPLSNVDPEPPKVGEVFPDLRFPVLGESELKSVSDFRGTKVLLIQFASW